MNLKKCGSRKCTKAELFLFTVIGFFLVLTVGLFSLMHGFLDIFLSVSSDIHLSFYADFLRIVIAAVIGCLAAYLISRWQMNRDERKESLK